ncbi:conjugal transfer protein TrbE, partial [Fusobacterium animalis]
DVDETMSYYHSFVSDNSHKIKVPRAIYYEGKLIVIGDMPELIKKAIEKGELNENNIKKSLLPIFIDSYITDSTLTGGINPQIGEDYIKTYLEFPRFFSSRNDG